MFKLVTRWRGRVATVVTGAALGLLGGIASEVLQPQSAEAAVTTGQQQSEAWMAAEAKRVVGKYNFTTITVTNTSLANLKVYGSATRTIQGGGTIKKYWVVYFKVVGSGSTRQLQAIEPPTWQ